MARNIGPEKSEDISVFVEQTSPNSYEVWYSPVTAGHKPDYQQFAAVENVHLANLLARIASDLYQLR